MQTFQSGGPFDHFQVERIMTVTGWGDTSKSNGVVVCSKDASHPENGVTLAIQKIPEQAYLLISAKGSQETWITAVWKDTSEIGSKNHHLMKTFARRFPEYHDVFGGLIVEATARGSNTGWRTVEENTAILGNPSPATHK